MIENSQASKTLVLVVDDDLAGRLILRRMLEMDGYAVDEAEDGVEALKKAEKLRPAIALVDALMPRMDGFDVCAHLHNMPREREIPTIMITALDDRGSIDRAFAAGALDYVTKPIHWPVLRHRLRQLLSARKAEKDLEEKLHLLRTLIDNIPDYIFAKDRDGRFTLGNLAHAQAARVSTPDELLGKTALDLFPPDIAPRFHADDQTIMQTGVSLISAERRTVDAQGNERVVLTTKVPLRDAQGDVNGLVGISRDITELKRATDALEQERNLLRTVMNNLPDYISVKDTQQRYIIANAALMRLLGITREDEIIGKTSSDVFSQDLATAYAADDQSILDRGQALVNYEAPTEDYAHNIHWTVTTKAPLRDLNGNIIGIVTVSHDITGRKQIEQAVRDSEERFRSLVQNSSDLITLLNADGIIHYQSPSVEHILGYPSDSWIGKTIWTFVHPDDQSLAGNAFAEIAKTPDASFTHAFRFQHRDGSWRILEGTGRNLLNNRAVEGIVTNFHDVTEHMQTEEALRVSDAAEREQRVLAEALRDTAAALATLDLETVMSSILVNVGRVVPHETAEIMLIENDEARIVYSQGYSPAFQAGSFRLSLQTPNLNEVMQTHRCVVVADTQTDPRWVNFPETTWIQSNVCAPIQVREQMIGMLSLNSATRGFFNVAYAERLQAFADQAGIAIENARLYDELRRYTTELERRVGERTLELYQAKEHVETILNNSGDAILVIYANGTISQTNPAFGALFGYQTDEVFSQPLIALAEPEFMERLSGALTAAIAGSTSQRIEVDLRRRDGTTFSADVGLSPIIHYPKVASGKEAREVVCIVRDITQRKQIERELQELNRMKTEFLSTAAHELRTPLTSIQGFSELLLTRDLEGSRGKYYMQIINEQSVHLRKLIDMLLDLSRLESKNRMALDLEPLSMKELVDKVLIAFVESLPTHHFRIEGLADCPIISGDAFRLSQVLQNLFSNAVKYSPRGGNITIHGQVLDAQLEISVQDEGIGMTPQQQVHLFERFYRADASNTAAGGTGLGLAISKLIVELHGGQMWVKSEYGVGTSVHFTLPLSSEQDEPDEEQIEEGS